MYHLTNTDSGETVATFTTAVATHATRMATAVVKAMRDIEDAKSAEKTLLTEFKKHFVLNEEVLPHRVEPAKKAPRTATPTGYWSEKWQCDPRFPSVALRKARREAMANRQPLPRV